MSVFMVLRNPFKKAEALSNVCIEQIQENFEVEKTRELIELMHLMVSRSN